MFGNLKTEEVALLLHGLRAVWVADLEKEHRKLTLQLEGELAARNVTLPESDDPIQLVA